MAEIILLLLLTLYAILLLGTYFSISQKSNPFTLSHQPKVAIIVAFRNEEKNLNTLIYNLLNQKYQNFEVYLINDHSNDNYLQIINKFTDERLHVLDLPHTLSGKKAALDYGIKISDSELLLFTDADCWMHPNWILSSVTALEQNAADWQASYINVESNGSFVQDFQSLESGYLVAISSFCMHHKLPTSCNGANILMRKLVYEAVNGFENIVQTPSGDDELLMQKIVQQGYKIYFNIQKEAIVHTKAEDSWQKLRNQRIRWASKLKYNLLPYNLYLSGFVFLFHVFSIILVFIDIKLFCLFIFVRFVLEFCLAKQVFLVFQKRLSNIHFVISFFVYPLYVMFMSVATQVMAFNWKERTYK